MYIQIQDLVRCTQDSIVGCGYEIMLLMCSNFFFKQYLIYIVQ